MAGSRIGRAYWGERADLLYYQYVYFVCRVVGRDANSALDVGSRGTPYLEWLDWIEERVSIDLEIPYSSQDVTGIKADFFDFEPGRKFDLTTCLQVLEHVPDVEQFGKKLLDISEHLVVSVPYLWSGNVPGHVNDPVSLKKLNHWMGRPPNYHIVVAEPFLTRNYRRLIAYYDVADASRRISLPERRARQPPSRIKQG